MGLFSKLKNALAKTKKILQTDVRDLFKSGEIAIPDDHQLMGELAALRYSFDSQGRVLMESKEAMRQRGLPSPDKADALMLAFLESANKTRLWT